jgi:hypothetical protein
MDLVIEWDLQRALSLCYLYKPSTQIREIFLRQPHCGPSILASPCNLVVLAWFSLLLECMGVEFLRQATCTKTAP